VIFCWRERPNGDLNKNQLGGDLRNQNAAGAAIREGKKSSSRMKLVLCVSDGRLPNLGACGPEGKRAFLKD